MSNVCFSSEAMSHLLEWRNQDWGPVGRVAVTEIGLIALTATAVIETVAYAALSLIALPFSIIDKRPLNFLVTRLDSSSFTVVWALADALFFNIFYTHSGIETQEFHARLQAPPIFHRQERDHLAPPLVHEELDPVAPPHQDLSAAQFIQQKMLVDVSEDKKTLVREVDGEIIIPFLRKALFIYAVGSEINRPLPNFFQEETRDAIRNLRKEIENNIPKNKKLQNLISQDLRKLIIGLDEIDGTKLDSFNKLVFNGLTEIAMEESRRQSPLLMAMSNA